MLGAQPAEGVRCALALLAAHPLPDGPEAGTCEVVLGADGGHQHLLRTVPDPHGDRLALAVVVDGPQRVVDRVRKRLRSVAVDALTAGPSMTRRPVLGAWSFAMPAPDAPAAPEPLASPVRTTGAATSGGAETGSRGTELPETEVLRTGAPRTTMPGIAAPHDEARNHGPTPDGVRGGSAGPVHPSLWHPALSRVDLGR